LLSSPAEIPASVVQLLSVEVEIAFRFDCDLPPRAVEYSAAEVVKTATELAGIEVVDSRFRDYPDVPWCTHRGLHVEPWRHCRKVAAGLAIVRSFKTRGESCSEWSDHRATQRGHSEVDPLRPAVRLANVLRTSSVIIAGQIVTTGTYTGLNLVNPDDHVVGRFAGFGEAEAHFRVEPRAVV
jgi:2-keto-4-pentenoate hydratase